MSLQPVRRIFLYLIMNYRNLLSHVENKWKLATFLLAGVIVLASLGYIYRYEPFRSDFEITDELGGNIFPVTILSTATTDAELVLPSDTGYIGNPKSCIGIRIKNMHPNSKLHIEVEETPFFPVRYPSLCCPKHARNIWSFRILYGNMKRCASTRSHFRLPCLFRSG